MMADIQMKNAYSVMAQICGDLPYTAEDRYYEMLDSISIAVVDYRVSHGLSQKQLADKLGVSQAMVSKYESGDCNISLKALIELFDKLAISFDIRFGDSSLNQADTRAPHMHYLKYNTVQLDETTHSLDETLYRSA